MKRCLLLLNLLCLSLLFGLPLTTTAQESEGTIADPLTVSGTVGTQITSSWNNADLHYNSPFSTTAYANMTFNVYGISIPMSLNFINVSAEQFAFDKPVFTLNFKPVWKKFVFHFGTSSMNFSNYTYNGISFTGVGVEYRGDSFRFGGFYGNFNKATKFRYGLDDRNAIQYLSDSLLGLNNVAYTTMPRYERKAYAAHIGVGSSRNFIDFSLLHAADDTASIPPQWYMYDPYSDNEIDTLSRDTIKGKENLALGFKSHFTFGEWGVFEANLGASLFTPDIARNEIVLDGTGGAIELANKVIGGVRKSRLFNVRYGSEIRFAGDAMLKMNFSPVTAMLTYRFVQPDYTSLGANGFNQNSRTFGGNIASSLFSDNATLSLTGYLQRDNLDHKQYYTNQVGSYIVNWNNSFGDAVDLDIMYNAVLQKQFKGTMEVPEEYRIDQITHSFDITPSYTLSLDDDHTFNLNYNLVQNKNRNELMEGTCFDVTTSAFGLGYEVSLSGSNVSVDGNYEYSLSRSPGNNYNSHGLSAGTTYKIYQKGDLDLSGNARVNLAYNIDQEETDDELADEEKRVLDYLAHRMGKEIGTEITKDYAVSARIGASLNYKDRHNASLYFSVSNYSDNIIIGQHVAVNTDVRFQLEYSYSFASRVIKSKKR